AAVVRWVTESCRPIKIVEDRKLREIVLAGRPQAQFSHRRELAQDIDTAFTVCSERIAKILKVFSSLLVTPIFTHTQNVGVSWPAIFRD
ncbi:hypothetical protein K435DRAFT_970193, partial [Dendrothele bispora CBS 962.96]